MNHHVKFNELRTRNHIANDIYDVSSLLTSHRIVLLLVGLSRWYKIKYKTRYICHCYLQLEYLGKFVCMELIIIGWLFRKILALPWNCNDTHLDCPLLSRYSHHILLSQSFDRLVIGNYLVQNELEILDKLDIVFFTLPQTNDRKCAGFTACMLLFKISASVVKICVYISLIWDSRISGTFMSVNQMITQPLNLHPQITLNNIFTKLSCLRRLCNFSTFPP